MKRIDPDVVVTASFTLHNGDGQLVDYAPQDQPMVWVFGYNQLLPALERELIGAQEGEVRKITLTPKDAYGEHVPSS